MKTWREAAGTVTFAIALFGPLGSWGLAYAQPTIQQQAVVSSSAWLGIATDTDTFAANQRHRSAPVAANAGYVSRLQTAIARPQAHGHLRTHHVQVVMHRKLPAPSDGCPDAH